MHMKLAVHALALLGCLGLLGCSGGRPKTYEVTGAVSYQGKPLVDAQVGFVPTATSTDTKPARGQTDASGRYTLKTYLAPGEEANGAMAGTYKVTIEKGLPENRIISYEDMKNHKPLIPVTYASAQQSPLSAEVTSAGPNTFDFTLEDAK